MSLKVNYLVACFLGERRVKAAPDPIFFIHKHLEFLQKHEPDLARVTFILNTDTPDIDVPKMEEAISKYQPFYVEIKLLVRENAGFSYAGWNMAINECVEKGEKFSHYWLLEDDYGPGVPDFTEQYLTEMKDNVGYVCQRLSHPVLSGLFNTQIHPGIACGLLLGQAAEDAYHKCGNAIWITETTRYDWGSMVAQVHFIDNIVECGYDLADSNNFSSVVFQHVIAPQGALTNSQGFTEVEGRGFSLVEYGNPEKPRVIEPYIDWKWVQERES